MIVKKNVEKKKKSSSKTKNKKKKSFTETITKKIRKNSGDALSNGHNNHNGKDRFDDDGTVYMNYNKLHYVNHGNSPYPSSNHNRSNRINSKHEQQSSLTHQKLRYAAAKALKEEMTDDDHYEHFDIDDLLFSSNNTTYNIGNITKLKLAANDSANKYLTSIKLPSKKISLDIFKYDKI